ncbi:ABC transporter ATP-binding protein [candidate division KSB3 bacterium]|uniref:ABC transporter ATP-binding protein n=1 Tax=candidate division KSB3 bacterium TaxID=2044937 RepID=A0A9D5JYB0_9BACT|nr:ABC transporter ATP-binding protein [candidate division KSB3 bacterium]MBD3326483.1 ABC transporter ATP-binding protein [candidate division KSB3 bacterium]
MNTLADFPLIRAYHALNPKIRITVLLIFLIALPWFIGSYWTQVLFIVGLYVMMGIGLNVAVGFAGLLVIGYAAFYGISAYAYVLLVRTLVPDPSQGYTHVFWILIPVCVLVAFMVGVLLGIPVLRTRGDYLAIVTLGFGEIVRLVLNNMDSVTNGPQGLTGKAPALFTLQFKDPIHFYYLILAGCFVAVFVADRLNNSRLGRAWIAMREDEDVARAMGINVTKYKLLAFAIGASFAGAGGAIFASRQGTIFPSDFTLMVSINVLCLIVIGGMGSIPGVVLGSVILMGLPEVLREVQQYRLLAYGFLLIIMMRFRPEGFIPSARRKLEFTRGD